MYALPIATISGVDAVDCEALAKAAAHSTNYRGVLRTLGLAISGSAASRLKKRLIALEIDCSHFVRGDISRIPAGYVGSARHLEALDKTRAKLGQKPCEWCQGEFYATALKKHEAACHLNPTNRRDCPVCHGPVNGNGVTCSKACANTHFRSGPQHPNWSDDSYRSTCFEHHAHKCAVCDEMLLLEVHHFDGDHSNNAPANLVPMCATHHQYWHSRYRHLIESAVTRYVEEFVGSQ